MMRFEDISVIGDGNDEAHQLTMNPFGELTSFGPDNTIGILELNPPELRVFDFDGQSLWSAGREGDGPGEFLFPRSLTWHRDVGWIVLTAIQNRIVIFSDDGQSHLTRSTASLPHPSPMNRARFAPDRSFWYLGSSREETGESSSVVWNLISSDWDSLQGRVVDRAVFEPTIAEGNTYYMQDSEHPRLVAVDQRGRAWWCPHYEFQIDVREPDGSGQWRIRREYERKPYSTDYRQLMESEPQMQTPEYRMFLQLPDKQPALSWLRWMEQNELWAFTSAYVDSPFVEVDVFDENGTFTRAFLAPKHLRTYPIMGDLILRPDEAEDGSPLLILSRWWIEERN
ncbi:hypothetical protein ACFL6R_00245 [Gemmatimonadota bacterium]